MHHVARRELEENNALGNITTQLFPEYGEFFVAPQSAVSTHFGLLSVFVKDGRSRWRHVGSLSKPGGLLADGSVDLLQCLLPHLHSSSKRVVNTYLVGKKRPFTRDITEFSAHKLRGRPEGLYFSWLDMGAAQVKYINPTKLTAALEGLKINQHQVQLQGQQYIYVIHQLCHSEKLRYFPSKLYSSDSWLVAPHAVELAIEDQTKGRGTVRLHDDQQGTRAFCLCRVPVSKHGSLGTPNYDVKLAPTSPYVEGGSGVFHAEVLDFAFTGWLASNVKEMSTKHIWQPALRDLYNCLTGCERKEALGFLLDALQMFRTSEKLPVQIVDLNQVLPSPPRCLANNPSILTRFLRGVGVVVVAPSAHDSDEEEAESQVVFQPANSQQHLKTMEGLLTVLVKEVVTHEQGESASELLAPEIVSLQELYFTQMRCVCSPRKALNSREEPLLSLWRRPSRTRNFLESLGLRAERVGGQAVVLCPDECPLINILFLFFSEID